MVGSEQLGERCGLCGRRPVGPVEVSLHGVVTCAGHPISGRCFFCGQPHTQARPPGWRRFAGPLMRCPTCLVDAVETQQEARVWLPVVRREMAAIGIQLPTRIPVRLVDPEELNPAGQLSNQDMILGVTESTSVDGRAPEVVEIRVAEGQPPLRFGQVVAHEMGHAWLKQHGSHRLELDIEEGLCELFAHGWLKRQRTPVADEMRRRIRENPDQTYGEGFRKVYAAAKRNGVATVMGTLARQGRLPT